MLLKKASDDKECWSVCYDAVELMDLFEKDIYDEGKDGTEL